MSAFVTSIHPPARSILPERRLPGATLQRRPLTTGSVHQLDNAISAAAGELVNDLGNTVRREEEVEVEEETSAQADSTPWYLQAQEPEVQPINPFAARQRLPELPSNSPPMLQPLLKHVSVDLGLDYLSIVDLRKLDPPPALGAGLIMIFGSVRSEKHLNVSADRLCRWLRSTYKLSPNADGLLGRNELKLKLRRKARRSRMLGAVGSSEPTNPDDGITTGWICVNVGEVEDGPNTVLAEPRPDTEGFVGFGKRTSGARIVVQMMTEEKRNEVDLESLWQGILDREGRKKEGERRAWERLEQKGNDEYEESSSRQGILGGRSEPYERPMSSSVPYNRLGQVRGYRTSARHKYANESRMLQNETETLDEDELEPHLIPSIYNSSTTSKDVLFNHAARHHLSPSTFDSALPSRSFDNVTVSLALRTQLDYLRKLNDKVARKQLGIDQYDRSSTTFLKAFYDAYPSFPEIEHWLCRIELQCFALKHAQPGYTRLRLVEIYRDMQASGIWIPEQAFMVGLEATLLSIHELDHNSVLCPNHETNRLNAFRRSLGFAFELMERMEAHGYSVRTEKIFLLLLEAISASHISQSSELSSFMSCSEGQLRFLADHNIDKLQHKFRRALNLLYVPSTPSDDPVHLALMQACITIQHWDGLWDTWRNVARMMKRRGPKMYALMFSEVAKSRHQAQCQRVLMECIPEMDRESPPITVEGEVARAVLECLVVARVDVGVSPWKQIVDNCKVGLGVR